MPVPSGDHCNASTVAPSLRRREIRQDVTSIIPKPSYIAIAMSRETGDGAIRKSDDSLTDSGPKVSSHLRTSEPLSMSYDNNRNGENATTTPATRCTRK